MDERQLRRVARKVVEASSEAVDLAEDLEKVERAFSNDCSRSEMDELERLMTQLENQVDTASVQELQPVEVTELQIARVDKPRLKATLGNHNEDPLEALERLFTSDMAEQMRSESLDQELKWDSFDYAVVGSAGTLATIADLLLVGLPSGLATGPVTAWMKQLNTNHGTDWFSRFARELEKRCRTPYDVLTTGESIGGMCGRTHRYQSLGHDPVLGFVFGVTDVLRGTISGFSYDRQSGLHRSFKLSAPSTRDVGLLQAFLTHIGHLISDVGTTMGLPAPFTPLLQAFNCGKFGRAELSIAEVARRMYTQGYDFRHFLSSGLSPGIAQATVAGLTSLRSFATDGPGWADLCKSLKYRRMSLAAHAIAVMGNAGKLSLFGGNPLAINQAQWMKFFASLGPTFKEWILQEELRLAHQQKINREGWESLSEWEF